MYASVTKLELVNLVRRTLEALGCGIGDRVCRDVSEHLLARVALDPARALLVGLATCGVYVNAVLFAEIAHRAVQLQPVELRQPFALLAMRVEIGLRRLRIQHQRDCEYFRARGDAGKRATQ